MLCYLWILGKI